MLSNWRLVKKARRYGLILIGIAIGAPVTMAVLLIIAINVLPDEILYGGDFLEAKRYIARLEEYKQKNGRYPAGEDQDMVPRSESSRVLYNGGGSGYLLDLALNFDVNYCYYSDRREWSFGICPKPK
jgi:hypothetical protein